ncbi:hypothetical protein ACCO45_004072 [Purpureocillium lilacinum]|uniref:Uncharacterized protein n=1 Tax=Purpureocillium lilacinum TaxID=33203 RepID=A0ACC4E477_PURLI
MDQRAAAETQASRPPGRAPPRGREASENLRWQVDGQAGPEGFIRRSSPSTGRRRQSTAQARYNVSIAMHDVIGDASDRSWVRAVDSRRRASMAARPLHQEAPARGSHAPRHRAAAAVELRKMAHLAPFEVAAAAHHGNEPVRNIIPFNSRFWSSVELARASDAALVT